MNAKEKEVESFQGGKEDCVRLICVCFVWGQMETIEKCMVFFGGLRLAF